MSDEQHQWEYFYKGRIKVKACVKCGDIHHSTNAEGRCSGKALSESFLIQAGYRQIEKTLLAS